MSNELQDTPEEPKPEVKPTDELADEQLDNIAGGIIIDFQPAPTVAPTAPQISFASIDGIKGESKR